MIERRLLVSVASSLKIYYPPQHGSQLSFTFTGSTFEAALTGNETIVSNSSVNNIVFFKFFYLLKIKNIRLNASIYLM